MPLQWRHNGRDGVSSHQPHHCWLRRLFRRRSKKTSKLRVTGLCAGNSPLNGEFPAQMAINAENVSIWWRHHGDLTLLSVNKPAWPPPFCTKATVGPPQDNARFICWSGLYSRSGKTSRHRISWSFEAARYGFRIVWSLWNLAAARPRRNFQRDDVTLTIGLTATKLHEIWCKTSYRFVNIDTKSQLQPNLAWSQRYEIWWGLHAALGRVTHVAVIS